MRPCPGGERRTMQSPRAIKSRVALSAGPIFIGFPWGLVGSALVRHFESRMDMSARLPWRGQAIFSTSVQHCLRLDSFVGSGSDDIVLGFDLILALSHALKDQQIDRVQDHVKGLIEEGREGLGALDLPPSFRLCGPGNEE